ncbi:M48 family metalloprotease [Fulvivirga sp. M361]|uniref:M48 family metallopeptidase n=1 Tax=Fulvivirga sp. M361 TaxID=2594266 RepID=UPI00117AD3B7|nr:M48 family metallopeptidase [Fulvivirga sp. M361]TRX61748.1 M48 family metalloprotease [Fulvivirga sp. M361]
MKSYHFFCLWTSLWLLHGLAYSQYDNDYVPMDSLGLRTERLIDDIHNDIAGVKAALPKSSRSELKEIFERKADLLEKRLKSNHFVNDTEVEMLVNKVYAEIVSKNPRKGYPTRIMISRSAIPNASCWGEGTMIINLGLLSRLRTESELAFIMAHEMAHQLLDHVNQASVDALKRRNDKSIKKRAEAFGKLEVLKDIMYDDAKYSRKKEHEADSMAVVLLRNTNYQWLVYEDVLNILDSADYPEIVKTPDLRSRFNFKQYTFKDKWLRPPDSGLGKSANTGLFSTDSVKSHPNISKRIAYLDSMFNKQNQVQETKKTISTSLQRRIDLELVSSSYILKDYAKSMFYTLQMLDHYPQNRFLKTHLARLLVQLHLSRKNHTYSRYVGVSNYYPKMMEEVFIFLNNLRMSEIGKLAYNYINRDSVFDKANEEHYYLLFTVSTALENLEVSEKVLEAYETVFPDGKYLKAMKY